MFYAALVTHLVSTVVCWGFLLVGVACHVRVIPKLYIVAVDLHPFFRHVHCNVSAVVNRTSHLA